MQRKKATNRTDGKIVSIVIINMTQIVTHAYIPSKYDWDLASVSELTTFAGYSHTAKRRSTEVEMGPPVGAVPTRTFVGHNYRHGSSRTYPSVQTPHLVAGPTPLTVLEQHRAHRTNSRPQRLHIHQRTVPTRPTCPKLHKSKYIITLS